MQEEAPAELTVRKMTRADIDRAVDVLARAFDDDPVLSFFVKPDARKTARIRRFLEFGCRAMTFPFGETYVTEGFEGVALWNPPGTRPQGIGFTVRLLFQLARFCGASRMPRMMAAFDEVERKHPPNPYYYLMAIGVEPALQGRGIAGRLMAPVLEKCDTERLPAYLEASSERSRRVYERHGFEVLERLDIRGGGPPIWLMLRRPR